MKCTVTVETAQRTLTVESEIGEKLLDVLVRAGIPVHAPCGGRGVCRKCLVKAEGAYSHVQGAPDGYALICQSKVEGDVLIHISNENASILADYTDARLPSDGEEGLGVAVDIGTTTLAGFLIDLKTGLVLSGETMLNPQRAHGADVVSRIAFSIEKEENASVLKSEIEAAVSDLTLSLLEKAHISESPVKRYSFAGNTAMMHFLGGYSALGLSASPFTPVYTRAHVRPFLDSSAYFGPCISGYVGADTAAAMLSAGFHETEKTILLIDIGTNGEIALIHKGNILCCSCAAGPAFEGAHIACGTGAVKGAIDHAFFESGSLRFTTIGNAPPAGICGSGLIDLVACLVEEEEISFIGRMNRDYPITDTVYISKEDVREVQLAKAAIASGIEVLIREAGIGYNDIDSALIAGGFGNFINLERACSIGLLPKSLLPKLRPIGNAAGEGARMALTSQKARSALERIAAASRYIELASHPDFPDLFAENLPFIDPDEF